MIFRRAIYPAFTITTNGGNGILQILQEILAIPRFKEGSGKAFSSNVT
jgi:hypothetical protein